MRPEILPLRSGNQILKSHPSYRNLITLVDKATMLPVTTISEITEATSAPLKEILGIRIPLEQRIYGNTQQNTPEIFFFSPEEIWIWQNTLQTSA
jgi:hypothetical protein